MRSLSLIIVLLFSLSASAQIAYILGEIGVPFVNGVNLPTSGFPNGSPDFRGPLSAPVFAGSGTPFVPAPAGGFTIDQVTATLYESDGLILQAENHTLYMPAGGPAAVPVLGSLASGGPITGLGVNSTPGGTLYMCDAISFQARSKIFPYGPAGAVIIPTFLHAPFTGMGYDPADNTLWFVDIAGGVFHTTVAGAAIGIQPVAIATSIIGTPMIGLDVNTSNGLASFPEPACSTALPGYHICVTDGLVVYDALNPFNPPIFTGPVAVGQRGYGLAFSSDCQDLRGGGICNSSGMTLENGLNRPSVIGVIPGPATSITCSNAMPFGTVTLWIDLCPIPGGVPLPGAGTLWINPFSPPITGSATANASGVATIPIPLTFAPANVTFACQWFAADPLNPPFNVCLSNGTIVTSGR